MKSPIRSNIELQRLRHLALSIGHVADNVTRRRVGLTTEDVRIVATLHERPHSTATDIAKMTLLTPVQVGRRLLRLKQSGYIAGETDPLDARAVRLTLTQKGDQAFEQTRTITERIQSWAIRDISDAEWEVFSQTLDKLLVSMASADVESHVSTLIQRLDPR